MMFLEVEERPGFVVWTFLSKLVAIFVHASVGYLEEVLFLVSE